MDNKLIKRYVYLGDKLILYYKDTIDNFILSNGYNPYHINKRTFLRMLDKKYFGIYINKKNNE